ncbi:MAG: hypothetical protein KME35_16125 [Aphanocapsa sp. GSE-SYN-MK-11-07L]|jgi:hypothetical protein|nr:hypothetical protein [Aphanocapsa sp. GSE-SYN-MK-11-07L]
MTTEQTIIDKVRVLSPEKQQEVLTFIELLQTDEWEQVYQKRFKQLQQAVQVGVEAANQDQFIDAEAMFQQLRDKMHQNQDHTKITKKRQWSTEFLSTFGAWQGEPLVRAPQEEASEREPF